MKKLTINRYLLAQRTWAVVVAAALGMAMPVGGNAAGASVVMSAADDPRRSYTATATYEGVFEPNRLYKILHSSGSWGGSPRPSLVRDVTCRAARTALEQDGSWKGALMSTGDCGAGEPTEWATGNYLNFQAERQDKESDS
jgi:hypothetical protein